MELNQIMDQEKLKHENPRLYYLRYIYGCVFREIDQEFNDTLYDGQIEHKPDSTEIIIASAKVY